MSSIERRLPRSKPQSSLAVVAPAWSSIGTGVTPTLRAAATELFEEAARSAAAAALATARGDHYGLKLRVGEGQTHIKNACALLGAPGAISELSLDPFDAANADAFAQANPARFARELGRFRGNATTAASALRTDSAQSSVRKLVDQALTWLEAARAKHGTSPVLESYFLGGVEAVLHNADKLAAALPPGDLAAQLNGVLETAAKRVSVCDGTDPLDDATELGVVSAEIKGARLLLSRSGAPSSAVVRRAPLGLPAHVTEHLFTSARVEIPLEPVTKKTSRWRRTPKPKQEELIARAGYLQATQRAALDNVVNELAAERDVQGFAERLGQVVYDHGLSRTQIKERAADIAQAGDPIATLCRLVLETPPGPGWNKALEELFRATDQTPGHKSNGSNGYAHLNHVLASAAHCDLAAQEAIPLFLEKIGSAEARTAALKPWLSQDPGGLDWRNYYHHRLSPLNELGQAVLRLNRALEGATFTQMVYEVDGGR